MAKQQRLSQIRGDFEFDILLYATGRKPNTAGLGLENTDIQVTDRGAIQVNRHLETSVLVSLQLGMSMVVLQFTYMSLDDFALSSTILQAMVADLETHRNWRQHSLLLLPLAQVGIGKKRQGLPIAVKELPVASMPRGHVSSRPRGLQSRGQPRN